MCSNLLNLCTIESNSQDECNFTPQIRFELVSPGAVGRKFSKIKINITT